MPIKKRNLEHLTPVDATASYEPEELEDDPELALFAERPEPVDRMAEVITDDTTDEQLELIRSAERFFAFVEGSAGQTPHPRNVAVSELLRGVQTNMNQNDKEFGHIEAFYRNRVRSPLTAIRAWCVLNEGGPKKANDCTNVTCPLWPFRQGRNAFYGKNK